MEEMEHEVPICSPADNNPSKTKNNFYNIFPPGCWDHSFLVNWLHHPPVPICRVNAEAPPLQKIRYSCDK
jgi:hypothetical protein